VDIVFSFPNDTSYRTKHASEPSKHSAPGFSGV